MKATLPTWRFARAALEAEGVVPDVEAVPLPDAEPEPVLLGEVALDAEAEEEAGGAVKNLVNVLSLVKIEYSTHFQVYQPRNSQKKRKPESGRRN